MNKDIEDLILEMTLKEKVSLTTGLDWWQTTPIERLGIPSFRMADGPYGLRIPKKDNAAVADPGTCFPVGVSLGATWNPELIGKIGEAIGQEARSRGIDILLGPTVDIHRTPLAGRSFESFSEDPFLSAKLALAYIGGVQSCGVGTCVKHFALNNSEFERMTISSEAGERAIREIYFPPFETAVREGHSWTVMSSYNKMNGTWASENSWLLSDILKGEWGFDGIVISDWFAMGSTVGSAEAGLDLEMPGPPRLFGDALITAVNRGEVSVSTIDEKVRRILRTIGRISLTPKKEKVDPAVGENKYGGLLKEAAEEAVILLKNDRAILPIDCKKIRSIAVIGPNAAVPRIAGGGSSRVTPFYAVTPLQALSDFCGDRIRLRFEQGCKNNHLTPLLDSAYLSPDPGSDEIGLKASYYANNDLCGEPVVTKLEKAFEFIHGSFVDNSAPAPGLDPDIFSARWTGLFTPPLTGIYRFGLISNEFCRIWVNEKLIIQKWKDGFEEIGTFRGKERVAEIKLNSGQPYSFKVEYCLKSEIQEIQEIHRLRLGCEIPLADNAMDRAASIAADSDFTLIFVGLTEEYDAEFQDREILDLPGEQPELIKQVVRVNPNTIVVLSSGSPVSVEDWISEVPGVLQTGYIGQEAGKAITDILFGRVNPSGKLTETYPKHLEDNPSFINYPGESGQVLYGEGIFVGYRYYDMKKIEPRFSFGHGLSYTRFQYDRLTIKNTVVNFGEIVEIDLNITNVGDRKGKEVVQLYVRDIQSRLIRPPKELKGFRKVSLEPGETVKVNFELTPRDLSYYDPIQKQWICEPGEFHVMVGKSSTDLHVQGVFTVRE
jgi:beta-glucosidase